jgi:CBS domain containing-hemolysin-like protein
MHVVFGQLVPKTMALQDPAGMALRMARPTLIFLELNRPLIFLINWSGDTILRWCGFHPAKGSDMAHSLEEPALSIEGTQGSNGGAQG